MTGEATEQLSRNFVLGDPVEFGIYLRRQAGSYARRHWAQTDVHGLQHHRDADNRVNRLRGIVIGTRTLANGRVEYDDSAYFAPEQHIRAYLVAYELHRAPVHVLPEDLTFL